MNLCVGEGCHVFYNYNDNFYNYIPKYTSVFFRWLSYESEKKLFSHFNLNKEGWAHLEYAEKSIQHFKDSLV